MLRLPGNLSAERFLAYHWQKKPLYMPRAVDRIRPAVTRNELAWLATLDDVESRIVFTHRDAGKTTYSAETGPFDEAFLGALPIRDWTLLVHDVEKHLPALRKLFDHVPFIPDWRIDDLMVSFAAPGGSVGPHRDNYDVFLCQGIGVRDWAYTAAHIPADRAASGDLLLVEAFTGEQRVCVEGDVLYLPPGVAHWGTAKRACMTYSIGMRAPHYFSDPDLELPEVSPGYISNAALDRAGESKTTLGKDVTELKEWLQPETPDSKAIKQLPEKPSRRLKMHGMARVAYDDQHVYANGHERRITEKERAVVAEFCARRRLDSMALAASSPDLLTWLAAKGVFEIPETA